jgi:hypothetical protein
MTATPPAPTLFELSDHATPRAMPDLNPAGRRKSRPKVRVEDSNVAGSRPHPTAPTALERSGFAVDPRTNRPRRINQTTAEEANPHLRGAIDQARRATKPKREPPPPRPVATAEEQDFRHASWWGRRVQTRAAMALAHYPAARLDRFDNCGGYARVVRKSGTDEFRIHASLCHDRFCMPCAVSRSLQIADNLTERLTTTTASFRHVVLTMRHSDTPLCDQVDKLYKSFRRLRDSKLWKQTCDGGAYFLQAHVSESDHLWHVHLHCIVQGTYLDSGLLSLAWLKATGDSTNVHVSIISQPPASTEPTRQAAAAHARGKSDIRRVALEVSRYAAKPIPASVLADPERCVELMVAIRGRHMCSTFGVWRKLKITSKPKPDKTIVWIDCGPIGEWIANARAGSIVCAGVLRSLLTKEHPAIGPPTLWEKPFDLPPRQV